MPITTSPDWEVQLASAQPFDLEGIHLREYKQLSPKWQNWENIRAACARVSIVIFDELDFGTR